MDFTFTMRHRGITRHYRGKLKGQAELALFGLRTKGTNTVSSAAFSKKDPIQALDALMRVHGLTLVEGEEQ